VESIFLPKSPSQERIFRIPGGIYAWKDVVATVEKVQGVEYTSTYHSRQSAIDTQKACADKGDMDSELAFSLKAMLGDPEAVSVPKPWDNDKFSFRPKTLEEGVRSFFDAQERGEDRLARNFPMTSQK
jgi:hypothetical protein